MPAWAQRYWVVVLAIVLFSWHIWGYDLWAPDEPYFGEGAREMVADGQWLVPHINGQVSTDKPPLFFWLIAIFSLPFGAVSSFTARLPSVLAAVGSVILTIRLGRHMAGPRTGALAGLMLATTHMFWEKARFAQIDSLLCVLILAALTAFESFRAGRLPGRRAGLVFWGAAALAVLAKGPVGLLLPLGVALATLAFDRDLRRWRSFAPLAGPLLFAAITGAWVFAVSRWATDYSVWGALREHFVERGLHGMHHKQPVWYYLKVLPYALLPWSLLLPGALLLAWRRRALAADRLLLCFALFVVAFFTVSAEKRNLYILPAIPAFALLFARFVTAVTRTESHTDEPPAGKPGMTIPGQRWITLPQGLIGAALIGSGLAAPIVVGILQGDRLASLEGALFIPVLFVALIGLAGGTSILAAAVRGKAAVAVRRSALTMALALTTAVTLAYPAIDKIKSGRKLGQVVRAAVDPAAATSQQMLAFHTGNVLRAVNLYSGGIYMEEVSDAATLVDHLNSPRETLLLANQKALPELGAALLERQTKVYSTRLSRRDLVLLRFEGR